MWKWNKFFVSLRRWYWRSDTRNRDIEVLFGRRVINRWHCRQEMTIVSLQSFKKELILYPTGITISLYCTLHANMEDSMLSNILLIIVGIQIPSNL